MFEDGGGPSADRLVEHLKVELTQILECLISSSRYCFLQELGVECQSLEAGGDDDDDVLSSCSRRRR